MRITTTSMFISSLIAFSYIPLTNRPSHHHHHHHHAQEQQVPSPAVIVGTPFKNAKESIPSPTGGFVKDLHAAHHHHVAPRSTPGSHAQTTNAKAVAPPPQPVIIPKPKKLSVSNQAVLDSVAKLPRNHLGDVPYEVKLKPARLQDPRTGRPPRYGYQSTPVPLPWDLIKDHLNCTLTVKVGKQHLAPAAREEITSRRALWGTDIYTDDSDVVAACIHAGWIRGEWPEEVDVDMLDLYTPAASDEKSSDKRGSGKAKAAAAKAAAQTDSLVVLDAPPKGGPQNVFENRDLHVTVLILPVLEKYASSCRFGIRSREFGGEVVDAAVDGGGGDAHHYRSRHDGLSFMITGLRWVSNGAGTQNRLRGKARRERIRRALREVELGPVWAARSLNLDVGKVTTPAAPPTPGTPIQGDVEMTGNWWKHRGTPPPSGSEGDKENVPAAGGAGAAVGADETRADSEQLLDDADEMSGSKEVDVSGTSGLKEGGADEASASKEVDADTTSGSKEVDTDETSGLKEVNADEASATKEVDADETIGDDTIVENDKADEEEAGDKGADASPAAQVVAPAEAVDSEKAAETASAGDEQEGRDVQVASPTEDAPKDAAEPFKEADAEPAGPAAEAAEETARESVKEPVAAEAEPTTTAGSE